MNRTLSLCWVAYVVAFICISYIIYLHYEMREECIDQTYLIGSWETEVYDSQRGQIRGLEFTSDGQVSIDIFMPGRPATTRVHEYWVTDCTNIAIDFNRPGASIVELDIEVLRAWDNEMIVTGFEIIMPRSWKFVRR